MDRLTGLQVFVLAVEEGSLTAAGRRLGLSAAMAGRHLRELESQVKARLLQRTTRSLALTDAGRRYYERCRRMLDEFEEANREVSDHAETLRGHIRMAAPVTFGALQLAPVVARFMAAHPEVTVQVLLSDRYVNLLESDIDLAIRIGELTQQGLIVRRIGQTRMLACAAPGYLARHGTPGSPEALSEHPRLTFSDAVSASDWTFTGADGRAHSIRGAGLLAADNMQFLLAAALAELGVVFGPDFVLGEHVARGELVALLPDHATAQLPIHAVLPTARHIPRRVRALLDLVAEQLAGSSQFPSQ